MLFALLAWVLRYGFFAYGSADFGVFLIVMSCIVYGMAFDFFLISGSMFVEAHTDSSIRSSAQGLFIMMTNGIGAYIGTVASSQIIDNYFKISATETDWHGAWLLFAGYSLVVAILFLLLFKWYNYHYFTVSTLSEYILRIRSKYYIMTVYVNFIIKNKF